GPPAGGRRPCSGQLLTLRRWSAVPTCPPESEKAVRGDSLSYHLRVWAYAPIRAAAHAPGTSSLSACRPSSGSPILQESIAGGTRPAAGSHEPERTARVQSRRRAQAPCTRRLRE